MPDRTIAEKLRFKSGMCPHIENDPAGADLGVPPVAWIGYPKGSKARRLDISTDTVFAALGSIGLLRTPTSQ